jgi:large repetitive protein
VDAECTPNFNDECPNNTSYTNYYYAFDDCYNASFFEQQIIVVDETAPHFVNFPADVTVSCENYPVAVPTVEAADNCPGDVLVLGPVMQTIPGNCPGSFVVTYTWGAIDICGNATQQTWTITVIDETAPVLSELPVANLTVACHEVPAPANVTVTDNCDANVELVYTETTEGNACNYVITRTWSATDNCSNSVSFTQTINVSDTQAPTYGSFPLYTSAECDQLANVPGPVFTDNCSDVTVTTTEITLSGGCLGVLVRTYTATDACGNTTTVQQYITILDTTPPSIVGVPANATVECSDVPGAPDGTLFGAGDVYGVDNCALAVTITYSEQVISGLCIDSYTVIRTWTAVDYCENVSTASQTVTVVDTTMPVWDVILEDFYVECSDEVPAPVYPTATDNCADDVLVVLAENILPGTCPGEYTIQRIFRGYDNCGNMAIQIQLVHIIDTTAPAFTFVPGAATYECNTTIPVVMATAADLCSNATVTYADGPAIADQECPQAYSFVRTFTATDECGNAATATQWIYVVDTTAPVFAGELEISLPCDNNAGIYVSATDNCGDVTITYQDQPVSGGCIGKIIRTYTATDECGNASYFTQIITLTDNVAPALAIAANATIECSDEVPAAWYEVSDNCAEVEDIQVSITEVIVDGDCAYNYTIVRTYIATDPCGNSTTLVQNINVQDTTDPWFTYVPYNMTYECDQDIPAINAQASDNCSEEVTVTWADVITAGNCAYNYTITRTFTAVDDCGNSATATQIITVQDTTAPVFTFVPANTSYECDENVAEVNAQATDNCGSVVVTWADAIEAGDCAYNYTIIRTFTAVDECGNSATATQIITVQDTTAPVFSGQGQISLPCDNNAGIYVSATDNCGQVTITYQDQPVSGGCVGTIIRTYTATDECGNSSTFVQIINLTDNVAPALAIAANATIECSDEVPAAWYETSDNCAFDEDIIVTITESIAAGNCAHSYTIVRTYTATDPCGNSTTLVQNINVQDTTAPVFTFVPSALTYECDQTVAEVNAQATDNCGNVVVTWADAIQTGNCAQNYTIVRTFTATDECGNSATATQIITVQDTTAPVFTFVPSALTYECDQTVAEVNAQATDNCGSVVVTWADATEAGDCPNNYTIVRTFTATDECGNYSTAVQYITVQDTTAPTFDQTVSDVVVECAADAPGIAEVTATDNCGEVEMSIVSGITLLDECGNYVQYITYYATDACGNTASQSYSITVQDLTAPVLSDMPGNLVLDCEDSVPAAPAISAWDNCEGQVEVSFTEEYFGDVPTPGSIADCTLSTPANMFPQWALWLQGFPVGYRYYLTISANFVEFPDGTAHLTGSVKASGNANAGWNIDVWFQDGMDWDTWSNQPFPTSYKDDAGFAGNNYIDWTYYIFNSSAATLTGWGDLEGSFLTLTHAPANLYYAFQVGVGANDFNGNYGMGGWFFYSGVHQNAALPAFNNGVNVNGAGDFAFDADCCPQYTVVRTWTATDCSGNTVTHSQTISFQDLGGQGQGQEPVALPAAPQVDFQGKEIAISKLFPNPTSGLTKVEFTTVNDTRINMAVYDILGNKVAELFEGAVKGGVVNVVDLDGTSLGSGIYLVRMSSLKETTVERLMIQR